MPFMPALEVASVRPAIPEETNPQTTAKNKTRPTIMSAVFALLSFPKFDAVITIPLHKVSLYSSGYFDAAKWRPFPVAQKALRWHRAI
jgi:hypothetical protein